MAMRASNYIIHVPLSKDTTILLQSYTGAYDQVSVDVAKYVNSLSVSRSKPLYGDWSPEPLTNVEVVTPSPATIELLKKRGYLTEMTPEEEEAFFVKMATKLHQLQSRLMPEYILILDYNCNLRCSYCFQDHMRTNPVFSHLLQTMQPETIDRILATMPKIERSHGVSEDADLTRPITFFGGEPLTAENYSIIKYTIQKTKALGKAEFSAVTNGTQLEYYQDLLGPEMISELQITLDGPSHEHDKRRIHADGSGSFDQIAKNITTALDLEVQVNVRMNIDRNNITHLPELADEIIARGWNSYEGFSAYTAPVTATNSKTDHKTTFNSFQLNQALDKMRQHHSQLEVIKRPNDPLITRIQRIFKEQASPGTNFKASFCGAHNKMYIFDPFGDIYACWEKTGDKKIRIGHIAENGAVVLNEELNQTWRNRTVISNPVCRKCPYAFYCGGGCAILAMNQNGSLNTNYCDGFANRFKASVAEAYQELVANTNVLPSP
ncbi:MAG: radical SAM protein [Phormidium sp.]